MKLQFVPDIQNWPRWWSVRLAILSGAFSAVIATYMTLPADWLPVLPAAVKQVIAYGALASAFGAAIARGIAQPKLDEPQE